MNLALPNVMRVLRTRYDMIAVLLQTAAKVHHNYAERIITHNLPFRAIIVDRMGISHRLISVVSLEL